MDKSDPTATDIERALALFRTSAEALFRTLTTTPACGTLLVRYRDAALAGLVDEGRIGALVDAVRLAAVIDPLFGAANETVPSAVSYFAPQAARSEYHVQWARTEGGQASIERVSEAPLPVAAFTYAQQRGHRVELDASGSEGEGLGYAWAVDGAGIGTGQTLEHDFAGAGRFDVTLTVTDRGGVTAEEQGSVTVTTGRAPEVRSLTCTPTGEGQAFTMQAGIADADEDIVSVEWFSAIANTRPDQTTGADEDSVTLSAPAGASYTRAKVRVVDAGGNAAQGSCPVELDPGAPVPRVAGASAEEGEALAFTLSLDSAPAEAVTYYYATYRGSAHTGDYTAHAGTALELAPGERSATITVQTTEDARIERNETLYLYIAESASDLAESPPSRYLARAAGTIRDDDETAEPAASVRIADAQAEEGEALAFTVTLDPAPAAAVTYYYATYRGTADRDDYTGRLATALRFASGERTKTITVRTTEDADDEDDETFFVYVTESTGELTASAPARYLARATGTIRDDDGEVTETCTGSTVHIPDAALHRAVEASLGKAHGARITPAEMRRLRSLYAQHKGIESLAGLQCATGLTFLYLYANQLTDVSPLSGLTALWGLLLSNNQLTDVSPLSGLTALRVLDLYDNQLTEVSLSGLTALTELYLYDNQLTEVSLSGLTALRVLDLNDNQISDVSPLSGLTALRGLHLDYNQISDVSPLSGLTALRGLLLSNNQLTDVSPLSGLTALWGLWLNDNQLTDVSPLSGLTALRGLYLDYNQISDIGPLVANAGLGRGDRVSLSRNPLSTQSRDVYIPALRARGAYVIY